MKYILRTISFIFCITLLVLICSCTESAPSTNEYTVTFKDYDGTILKEEVVQEGHEATAPSDPIRDGYIFIGWSDEYTNVKKNTICIAQYEKVQDVEDTKYTVTFDSNGGTIIESQQVEKGNNVVEPVNPTKVGYTFIGWYLNDEKWSFIGYTVTKDITLVAKWNINTYEITYDINNGIVTNPTTYTVEDKITLNNPTKEHYEFIGWTSDTIQEPQLNVNINNEIGNKHFVANYKPITYTISFDSNGGNQIEDIKYTIETNNIELPTPTRDGYDFLGWYENDVLVTEFEIRDYILVAKWEKIEEEVNVEIYEENGQLYVNFGRYPQTVVTDENIINVLTNISTENEFGYIEYNGNEYKKVVANPDSSVYTFINGNAIIEGNTYYFLVEPIKWRVLEEKDGTYKLLSEMIIDNTDFYHTIDQNRTINGETIYPNNYEYSNIRAWLNGYDGSSYNVDNYTNKGFLDIAFTEEEKLLINTTLVDNSLASTGDSSNEYICNNTTDKIYLLSVKDTLNTNYGFSSDSSENDIERIVQVSDYARSKECYMNTSTDYYGNGVWWHRSPSSYISYACVVHYNGLAAVITYVHYASHGVRPALTITIDQSNKSTVTLDVNGGDPLENDVIEIEYDSIFDITPQRDGYEFLGWYTENDELVELGPWKQTSDLTLVAKWKEIKDTTIEIYEENGYTYINLGRYPQTVVTEETIINALSNISTINSLGYIEHNGNEYKKVVANPYSSNYTFINGNTIIEGNTYYFLVEPIKWRVLEENNGTYKLLCEMIIDDTNFYHTYDQNRTINGETIYPNNYEYSNIRAWLNGYDGSSYNVEDYTNKGFLDIAFTEEEQKLINNTLVDNSLASTGDSSNSYICNDTTDKIYLLSVKDTLNTNYGFSSDSSEYDIERRAQVSDYARSKDCYMNISTNYYGNGVWWLRSPFDYDSYYARVVYDGGGVNIFCNVNSTRYGVRPAITITIK